MNKCHLETETCFEQVCEQKMTLKTHTRTADQGQSGNQSGKAKIQGGNFQELESYSTKHTTIKSTRVDGSDSSSESAFERAKEVLQAEIECSITLLLKPYSARNIENSLPYFENYQQEDFEDHISSDQSPIPAQEIENCLDLLENHETIREYLQWIYDTAPHLLINDLILAVYLTIKTAKWNQYSGVSRIDLTKSIMYSFGTCWSSLFKALRIQVVPALFGGYMIVGEPIYINCLSVFIESTLNIFKEMTVQKTSMKYQDQTEFECSSQSQQRPSANRKEGKKIKKGEKRRNY